MRGLLYREFVQNKWTLLLMAGTSVFCCMPILLFSSNGTEAKEAVILLLLGVYLFIFGMINLMEENLFAPDETGLWPCFVQSTPSGIQEFLWVKYEFILIVNGLALVLCHIVDLLCSAIYDITIGTVAVYIIFFFWQVLMSSFDIPFTVCFGSKRGGTIKAFCMLALILLIIVYALFGDLSMFGSPDIFYEFILGILEGRSVPDWLLGVMGIFPFAACGIYYLSYRISCKLYKKGAGHYGE